MSYRVRFRREVVELGGKDRELVRGGGHKKEEEEEKEVDAVSKREVFSYVCSRSRNFFYEEMELVVGKRKPLECERDQINAISNVLFQSVTSYVCTIQLTSTSFSTNNSRF